jgi:hypothetical protein
MKTIIRNTMIGMILMLNFSVFTFSQPSTYENGDGSYVEASATNQGGSGPVSGPLQDGIIQLILFASVYGVLKYYSFLKRSKNILSDH